MITQLYHGDCLDVLPTLPDDSVDLIATDPPYYRVKDEPWDRQWETASGFLAWLDRVLEQFARVLRPNGSLYLFASPKMAARVEVLVGERFSVIQRITWAKPPFSTKAEMFRKDDLRVFFPSSEAIIFAEHYGADSYAKGEAGYGPKCDELRGFVFEPLRAYLADEWQRAGLTPADANTATDSFMAGHYLTRSQWTLPTLEKYHQLRAYANSHNHGGEYLRREYEDLRRPFYATAERPYTDVWDFPTVAHYPGKHPCEKPLAMMEHIILTSSRPGAVVLDAFMGGGTTGEAAQKHGRDFIGIEMAEHWHQRASERLAYVQPALEMAI